MLNSNILLKSLSIMFSGIYSQPSLGYIRLVEGFEVLFKIHERASETREPKSDFIVSLSSA